MYTSCIAQVVTIMHLFGRFAFKLSLIDRYLQYSATDLQLISIVNEYKFPWWFRRLGIAHIGRLQHGKPSDATSGGSRKRLRSVSCGMPGVSAPVAVSSC